VFDILWSALLHTAVAAAPAPARLASWCPPASATIAVLPPPASLQHPFSPPLQLLRRFHQLGSSSAPLQRYCVRHPGQGVEHPESRSKCEEAGDTPAASLSRSCPAPRVYTRICEPPAPRRPSTPIEHALVDGVRRCEHGH
jgi:hypothetical protein